VISKFIVRSVETLFRNRRTSLCVPVRVSVSFHLYFRLQGDETTHQSSECKKSLQSARSISLTPGSRTIELMGRFGRAPVHVQHPHVLNPRVSDPTRKDGDQYLRVSHVDVNSVLGVLFIFAFCFENKLFQDVVITCDDAGSAIW